MVNQKSDGFRSLTGFHGGLRRGTAAAAFGAVLVLSAGVPASNAATSELPASDLLADPGQGGTAAGTGLDATVDAAGLEAWAAAALSNERSKDRGSKDRGSKDRMSKDRDRPAEPAPSESPSVPPSLTPVVPVPTPVPSMTLTARPTPDPSVTATATPTQPAPAPSPSDPGHTDPAPSPAPTYSETPTHSETASPSRPAKTSASPEAPAPSETQPSGTPSQSGSWSGSSAGTGGSSLAGQAPAGQSPASSAPGTAGSSAPAAGGSQGAAVNSSTATTETPSADASPFEEITGLSGGSALRGRSAAGVAGGVWGSAQLAGPNNMATISSPYTRGPAESAVMGVSRNGTIEPQVWWGAGLLALAGAAGVAAVRIRRSL